MEDRLENYDKIKIIGHGSYGEVWLVKHKGDKREYVLKKLDLRNASAKERRGAEQECRLLSQLKHPNIVTYKESFETSDGFLYISMRYCEAGDLYTKLKKQKGKSLEEKQIVEWFIQIAMALRYMHSQNIMHRDLKTQNIFLTKNKIIKVGDLGIARVLDSSGDMAKTLIGTPYYMSPEIFSNKPYNFKSDVWALGCCVFEMVTLKHAFNGKDLNSLMYQIHRGRLPPMPETYSVQLKTLIKAMMQKVPERRPSVERILKDSFIQKHIAIFLKETKKSQVSNKSITNKDDQTKKAKTRSANHKVEIKKSEDEAFKAFKYPLELEVIPEESVHSVGNKTGCPCGVGDRGVEEQSGQFKKGEVNLLQHAITNDESSQQIIGHNKSDPFILKHQNYPRAVLERSHSKEDVENPPSTLITGGSDKKPKTNSEVNRLKISSKAQPTSSGSSRPLPQLCNNSGLPKKVLEPIHSSSNPVRQEDDPGRNFPCQSISSSSSSSTSSTSISNVVEKVREKSKHICKFSVGIRGINDEDVPDSARPDTARGGARERRRQRVMNENLINFDVTRSKLMMSSSNDKNQVKNPSVPDPQILSASLDKPSSSSSSSSTSLASVSSSSSFERRKSDPDTKPKSTNMPLSSRLASSDKLLTDRLNVAEGHKCERREREERRYEHSMGYDAAGEEDDGLNASPISSDPQTPEEFMEGADRKSDRKEMKKFLYLLGTLTLRRRKDEHDADDIEDADDDRDHDVDEDDADGSSNSGNKYPKDNKDALRDDPEFVAPRNKILPFDSGEDETLSVTSTGVLYDRISNLKRDCIKGLGVTKLMKAYEILDKFDEEDLGAHLLELLGQSDYDDYAGKIMQLKYYEDTTKYIVR